MTPAARLKAARKALGFSVEQMADALGLRGDNAGDDVRNWERGRREPSGVVVVAAEALSRVLELELEIELLEASVRAFRDS